MIERATFSIVGFGELGTDAQDYGNGIVRLHHGLPAAYGPASSIRRNSLVRIENPAHDRVYAVCRFTNHDDPYILGLEYDARARLGLKKGQPAELTVRRALAVEYVGYLWSHSNVLVRIEFRLALALTVAAFLLGLAASGLGF